MRKLEIEKIFRNKTKEMIFVPNFYQLTFEWIFSLYISQSNSRFTFKI